MNNLYITAETQDTLVHPVFLAVLEKIQNGAMLDISTAPASLFTLYAGCPLATTATQGRYKFLKSAIVATAKADGATRIKIDKQMFKVGEVVGLNEGGAGTTATLTVVAATYLVTALTNFTLTKKQVIYQVAADGATTPSGRPYALLGETVRLRDVDASTFTNVIASAVVRGSVAISSYPYGYTTDIKNRLASHLRFVETKNS